MPQSLSGAYLHLIFSTRDRIPYLRDAAVRGELHAYLGGISREMDCPPMRIGGVADHVHILARFGRSRSQAEWVKELKRVSTVWLKGRGPEYRDFAWQGGYATFSVSASLLDRVARYIDRQEEHHRQSRFEDELRSFLRRYDVAWDDRFLLG